MHAGQSVVEDIGLAKIPVPNTMGVNYRMVADWGTDALILLGGPEESSQAYWGWNENGCRLLVVALLENCCSYFARPSRKSSPSYPYLCHWTHWLEEWERYGLGQGQAFQSRDVGLLNAVVETSEVYWRCSWNDDDGEMEVEKQAYQSYPIVAASSQVFVVLRQP